MTFTNQNATIAGSQDGIAISYQDSAKFKKHEFSLYHKGMCLKSRLSFEIGSELAISIELPRRKVDFNGIVVGCRNCPTDPRTYDITIFFHEQTPELLEKIEYAAPYFKSLEQENLGATPELAAA